jgi:hypothetical protein
MHEVTSVAEFKRLFGPLVDEAIKVDVPGMEVGTQHSWAEHPARFQTRRPPMRRTPPRHS